MIANKSAKADRVVWGFTLLAVVQISVLVTTHSSSAAAVQNGHDFSQVEVLDRDSIVSTLATGEPTLVLVFHSSCVHCTAVAPTWSAWLTDGRPKPAVIAVSSESHADGLAYAEHYGWKLAVRSAVVPLIGGQARVLVRLTPWVYGLDGGGIVVATGHGSEVDRVATELMERAGS